MADDRTGQETTRPGSRAVGENAQPGAQRSPLSKTEQGVQMSAQPPAPVRGSASKMGQTPISKGDRNSVPNSRRAPVPNGDRGWVPDRERGAAAGIERRPRSSVERTVDVEQRQISNEARLIRGVFRAAGLAAGSVVRGGQWAVNTSYEVTREITQAALEGESSAEIAERTGHALRSIARSALGVTEGSVREIVSYVPTGQTPPQQTVAVGSYLRSTTVAELRKRGDALLARSADVYFTEEVHPAYDRILDELAPDEARILRYMALNGPQPTVDVRTNRPLGIGSELIAGGLTSVPEQAGVRYLDRARSYLINLSRLGLTHNSDDPVVLSRYMVLEVQPIVEDALRKAGRAPKIARKSLRLTEFGEDFCRTCFTIGNGERL